MKKIYELMNNSATMPNLTFNSEWFKCPRCGWAERRLIRDSSVSYTPCPKCGNGRMIRV